MSAKIPDVFFSSMFRIYEAVPEDGQQIIISELVKYQHFEEFLQFLLRHIGKGIKAPQERVIWDVLTGYMTRLGRDFKANDEYISLLLKVCAFKTPPTDSEKFLDFAKLSTAAIDKEKLEIIYPKIMKLPVDRCLMLMAAMGVSHPEFMQRAFSRISDSVNTMVKEHKEICWFLSMEMLLTGTERLELSKNQVVQTFQSGMQLNVPSVRKMNLLCCALRYFQESVGIRLAELFYVEVSEGMSMLDIAEAVVWAKLSLEVLKLLKVQTSDSLSCSMVQELFVHKMLVGYRPNQELEDVVVQFLSEIGAEEKQELMETVLATYPDNVFSLFLISKYPSSAYLPVLFSRDLVPDQDAQYYLVRAYLSSNEVPLEYIPRLFEILKVEDFSMIRDRCGEKVNLFWFALLKFLSVCDAVEKVEYAADLVIKTERVPIIPIRHSFLAFLVVSGLRAYSNLPPQGIRILLDYLHCCSAKARERGVAVEGSSGESLCLTQEDEEMIQNEDFAYFEVAPSLKCSSAPGYCQAQVVQNWCVADSDLCKFYYEYALERVRAGKHEYSLMVASICSEEQIIREIVSLIRKDEHMLVFFFASVICCSPVVGLEILKAYVLSDYNNVIERLWSGKFEGSELKHVTHRQRTGRKIIIASSPFILFSPLLLEVLCLLIAGSEQKKSGSVCDAIISVCTRLPTREDLQVLIDYFIRRYTDFQANDVSRTLEVILSHNSVLGDDLRGKVIDAWISVLLMGEVLTESSVEKELFQEPYLSTTAVEYLKQLQEAMSRSNESFDPLLLAAHAVIAH